MNEVEFREWLLQKDVKKKVQSDCISRIRRVEREINNCDIDEQYRSDKCEYLMSLFANVGNNEAMKAYPNTNFPIGKYHMNTYRHAVKKYIQFCDEVHT